MLLLVMTNSRAAGSAWPPFGLELLGVLAKRVEYGLDIGLLLAGQRGGHDMRRSVLSVELETGRARGALFEALVGIGAVPGP